MTFSRWCAVVTLAVAVGACNREPPVPAGQSQAATQPQATNQPATVQGCLRAGEAPDTFVLTGEKSTTGDRVATYQLQPAAANMQLADHVDHQVEVTGTIVAQQEITTRSSAQPAEKSTGTAGTPTVSTATELDIKRLNVTGVRPLGDKCPDDR